MKNTIKILALFMVLSTVSCSSDGDDANAFDIEELSGNWFGSFEGDDSGTWAVFAYPDGRVTGTAVSNNLQQTLSIEGNIDDQGNLDAVLGSAEPLFQYLLVSSRLPHLQVRGTTPLPMFQEHGLAKKDKPIHFKNKRCISTIVLIKFTYLISWPQLQFFY